MISPNNVCMCILRIGKRPEVFPNYWEMATIFQNKISKLLKLYNSTANIPQSSTRLIAFFGV